MSSLSTYLSTDFVKERQCYALCLHSRRCQIIAYAAEQIHRRLPQSEVFLMSTRGISNDNQGQMAAYSQYTSMIVMSWNNIHVLAYVMSYFCKHSGRACFLDPSSFCVGSWDPRLHIIILIVMHVYTSFTFWSHHIHCCIFIFLLLWLIHLHEE